MPTQQLVFETQICTGCRACEIACTFHHRGEFGRRGGSLVAKREGSTVKFIHQDHLTGTSTIALINKGSFMTNETRPNTKPD